MTQLTHDNIYVLWCCLNGVAEPGNTSNVYSIKFCIVNSKDVICEENVKVYEMYKTRTIVSHENKTVNLWH